MDGNGNAGRLHVRDIGDGRPLVLVHGWSCPGRFFDGQVEALSAHARCIVPDLPGHGQTGAGLPLTLEAAADALHAFLEAEDIANAIVCGWSMGAHAAYAMIERHGTDRIAGVVTIDMSPKVLNDDEWRNGILSGLTAEVNETVLAAIVNHWNVMPANVARQLFASDRPVEPDLLALAEREIAKENPALLQPMWASMCRQDFRDFLADLAVPLHFVCGAGSQLYGEGVRDWHRATVPDVRVHVFEQSGHAPHLEEPHRFNSLILEILQA
ncbi:alpha/beta hydrolase [Rhodobacterales bacterium]|nr:alpha/beta hydrolase [Rhodobacterales bacterium]